MGPRRWSTATSRAAVVGCRASSSARQPSHPDLRPIEARDIGRIIAGSGLGTLPDGIGIPVGERAPDASLQDADGRAVQLSDLVAKGPILLVLYRGGWCPYCNFQIRSMTTAASDFERRGVTPVAVSVDRTEEAARTKYRPPWRTELWQPLRAVSFLPARLCTGGASDSRAGK